MCIINIYNYVLFVPMPSIDFILNADFTNEGSFTQSSPEGRPTFRGRVALDILFSLS